MEISKNTAAVIFNNPEDLVFSIGEDPEKKKYGFVITGGPLSSFRQLFILRELTETKETAIAQLQTLLNMINQFFHIKSEASVLREKEYLNDDRILKIVQTLKEHPYVFTGIIPKF